MSAACARSSRPSSVFCPDIQPHKIFSACCKNPQKQPIIYVFGVWRSLVAHLHGVQGVASSNPATPTNKIKGLASQGLGPCSVLGVKTGSAAYNGQGTFRHWCHHAENIFRLSRYCNVRQLLARHGATNKKRPQGPLGAGAGLTLQNSERHACAASMAASAAQCSAARPSTMLPGWKGLPRIACSHRRRWACRLRPRQPPARGRCGCPARTC